MNHRYWKGLGIASVLAALTGQLLALAPPVTEEEGSVPVLCPIRLPGVWGAAGFYVNWNPHTYAIDRALSAPEGGPIDFTVANLNQARRGEMQAAMFGTAWYIPGFRGPVHKDGHSWYWEARQNRMYQPAVLYRCQRQTLGAVEAWTIVYTHTSYGAAYTNDFRDDYAVEADACTEEEEEEDGGGDDGPPPPTDEMPDNDNPGGEVTCVDAGGSDQQYCYQMFLYWIDGDGDYHEILIDEWCQSTPIEPGLY